MPSLLSRRATLVGPLVAALALPVGLIGKARAGTLAPPAGAPILTISGRIAERNRGDDAVFDAAMLERLGMATIRTHTPWHEGVVTFEGPRMDQVMAAVGADGTSVEALALNDYVTEIPMSDFKRYGTLLALKRNGAYMPVADKGPLFIIYPYDSDPALAQQQFYNRSAWQVARLVVR